MGNADTKSKSLYTMNICHISINAFKDQICTMCIRCPDISIFEIVNIIPSLCPMHSGIINRIRNPKILERA